MELSYVTVLISKPKCLIKSTCRELLVNTVKKKTSLIIFHSDYIFKFLITFIKSFIQGLPWWHSGWESACQCRGHGFEPWSGRIPHAAEQLGPWATTTEPALLEPVLPNERPRQWEARAPRWRVAPARRNWRKPSHKKWRPNTAKNKQIYIKKKKVLSNGNYLFSPFLL